MLYMSGSPTILYAEDNFENRLLVRRLLESEGYNVVEAERAIDAINLAKQVNPALILVDINMPDMDGFTLTATLRTFPEFATTPIIALTANVTKGVYEKTVQAGCSGYIEKPIDIDRFLVEISKYLGL
jgi:two-component system, cell cycle response regulator DivK